MGEDGTHSIWTSIRSLHEVARELERFWARRKASSWRGSPASRPKSGEDDARTLLKLIDVLDDDDDVQTVWGNYEIPDDVMEKLG